MSSLQTIQRVRKRRRKARRAATTKMRGVKVKPEEIDYKNVAVLQRLMSAQGKLFSRKRSGLDAASQRAVTREVKRARFMALLPFAS